MKLASRSTRSTVLGLGTLLLAAPAPTATTTYYCPTQSGGICFAWAVPDAEANSAQAHVYFQLQAPSHYQWVGLGIGSSMAGSSMFLMYPDGEGNVTLSTRKGTGHRQPQESADPHVQLLAGSGVRDGQMTANLRCSNCSGLAPASSSSWIAAWRQGEALDSKDPGANIQIHHGTATFSVNLADASTTSAGNPFAGPSNNSAAHGGSSNKGPGVTTGPQGGKTALAHGIVMTLVFSAGYPVGSSLQPWMGSWKIHASWQILVFLAMWAGFGLGLSSVPSGQYFQQAHTALGTMVVALLAFQPALGWFHHRHFRKYQRRGIISYIHIWYGRALMVAGVVCGGLGLGWAQGPQSFIIAYSVIATVFFTLYVASSMFGQVRRRRRQAQRIKESDRSEESIPS